MPRQLHLALFVWVQALLGGVVVGLFAGTQVGHAGPAPEAVSWDLVWSDEFSGAGQPDSTRWNYHVGNGWNSGSSAFTGWGNGEWAWYRPENCYQEGGNLVLRADYNDTPTSIGGRDWYQFSCRITSDTDFSTTYGAVEARIRMPAKAGTWPAFWMMGDVCDDTSTSSYTPAITHYDVMATNWSSCGEIDIMEHRNSETAAFQNLFWDTRTGLFPWSGAHVADNPSSYTVGDVTTFHTYRIEWNASAIRWFVDGTLVKTQTITAATQEEFHRPFHLILNLALSGTFTGPTEPQKSDFPLYMQVDYVRVYQAAGTPPPADFTGDGTSEVVIFRSGAWHMYNYADGSLLTSVWTGTGGGSDPTPLLMDYDGDGNDDLTIYDSGAWHFFNDNGTYNKGLWVAFDALPVPADYDGDGDDDLVLFDQGAWHRFNFTSGAYLGGVWTGTGTGSPAKPAPMDYDGDGTADFTVYNSGAWHFFNDDGSYLKGVWVAFTNGIPAPGDYDADGVDDVVLFDSGAWHFFDFASGSYNAGKSVYTGIPTHKYPPAVSRPAPLDINGDSRMDYAMYAGGPWHFYGYDGGFVETIATGGVMGDIDVSGRPASP